MSKHAMSKYGFWKCEEFLKNVEIVDKWEQKGS